MRHRQRIESGLCSGITEAQRGSPPVFDLTRSPQVPEGVVPRRTVVTDLLDLDR
jgi:hypothetical protein